MKNLYRWCTRISKIKHRKDIVIMWRSLKIKYGSARSVSSALNSLEFDFAVHQPVDEQINVIRGPFRGPIFWSGGFQVPCRELHQRRVNIHRTPRPLTSYGRGEQNLHPRSSSPPNNAQRCARILCTQSNVFQQEWMDDYYPGS